jgi:hypothetical protein
VSDHTSLIRFYRVLQHLYPRSFRRDYGPDMVELFRAQLADESPWRVCTRTFVNLSLTVPVCHVEAHMNRKLTPVVVLIVTALLAAATFSFIDGLLGVFVALAGSGLAVVTWRHERPAAAGRAAAHWWQLLGVGVALLAAVIVCTTLVGELNEVAWLIAAITFLTSFAFIGAGSVMAFLRLGHKSSDLAA